MTARKPIVLSPVAGTQQQLQAGDTLLCQAPTTANASLNLPHGTAPTSPADGDVWTTTGGIYARINGATIGPFTSIGGMLDQIGSTQGDVLFRGASGWSVLAPGTSGDVLQTNGAGADPTWASPSGGGGGGGSAPTYRGGTLSGAITGTSATLTLPTGSIAGDFLVFIGAGGNGGYPTSSSNGSSGGWTRITALNSFWNVEIFTRTVTSADITAGNIPVTVTGSFINYAGIFTFATGAYMASFGVLPLSFDSTTAQMPTNPTLMPQVGKVDANPNMFWLIMVSCRGVNAAQGLDSGAGTSSQIGSSGTNTNGSASFFQAAFSSGLPIVNPLHTATAGSLGDVMLGILNP